MCLQVSLNAETRRRSSGRGWILAGGFQPNVPEILRLTADSAFGWSKTQPFASGSYIQSVMRIHGGNNVQEREAIRRMRRGDIGGLAALVQRYQVPATRAAYLVTQDRRLAEDVVQAAFIQAFRHIHQFDPARPFAPWFFRSVLNAAVQAARRDQRQVSLDGDTGDLLPDPAPRPEEAVLAAETQQAVRLALEQLSPEQRAAVVMRYYLDLSEAEMAAALAVPAGTIKWRLHAARRQLKLLLRGRPGWEG